MSSDSRLAVTLAYDNTARLWDLNAAQCVGVLHHNQAATRAVFSEDSKFVLTASADNVAYLWALGGSQPLLKHVLKVGFPSKFLLIRSITCRLPSLISSLGTYLGSCLRCMPAGSHGPHMMASVEFACSGESIELFEFVAKTGGHE